MAIKGLIPSLAERGKIKCGGLGEKRKKQGKEEYYRLPVKHDHFTITGLQRNEAGDLIPDKDLMKAINPEGGKLTEIPVRLLYNDPDLNFPTRLACYKGNRAWCTGNGEFAQRFEEGEGSGPGKYGRVSCPCERWKPDYAKLDKCKTLGTLQVLIDGVDRVGGVWKFRTTSYNSVTNLLSSMALILQITGGRLAGLPLNLVLSPKTVTVPTSGQSMVVFVASLEYRGSIEELRRMGYDLKKEEIEHQVRMDLLEDQARKLLVSPHEEPEPDQRETAAEFYPDVVDAEITPVTPQNPPGEKEPPPPAPTPTAAQKPTTAPSSQSEGGENGGGQGPLKKALTFPQLMETVQAKQLIEFPTTLMATKGVELGELVDRFVADDGQTLVLEMREDMPQVSDGLTEEKIGKFFKEAGVNIIFQAPGTFKEGPPKEEEAGDHDELTAGAAQANQAQAAATKKQAPAKPLF